MALLSAGLRSLIERVLGIDYVYQFYEKQYLKYRKQKSAYITYDTGRDDRPEQPQRIFRYYNDLSTKPSNATIQRAKEHFMGLVEDIPMGLENQHLKVKRIAKWVTEHTDYERDSERWGSPEYWSSPFDLWAEYERRGRMSDDCDGYSGLIYWGCRLVGIRKELLFVWAGNARRNYEKEASYGHSNLLYDTILDGMYHVEGSFYYRDNQRDWLGYNKKYGGSRYPDTWFYFNESGCFLP